MLLTLKQPVNPGYRSFHDYTPPTPPSSSRFSPSALSSSAGPSTLITNSIAGSTANPLIAASSQMSTPHRGLPPPAAMTLPQPTQQPPSIGPPPPSSLPQHMGPLPAPPQQWQGAEESMRNWLHAKAEEDKRKQEEEKTRQETLRLEQRKIEQDMLRTSLSGGIPPHMIPMVFAGMGGGNVATASLEWAQQYMSLQLQQQQHPQPPQLLPSQAQTPPDQLARDPRTHQVYANPAPMTLPSTPTIAANPQQLPAPQQASFIPGYQMSPASRSRRSVPGASNLAQPSQVSSLPRLNTGEMHIQPPPAGPSMAVSGQATHPLQQSQTAAQSETQSSPGIYFHHWQPPTSQAGTSGTTQPTSSPEHPSSPKKRKATGPQQAPPPPTSQPQYTSPSFSQAGSSSVGNTPSSRRRAHSRQASDVSARGLDTYGRPISRHRHAESSFNMQSITGSPTQITDTEHGTRPRRSGSNPVSAILEQPGDRPPATAMPRDSHYGPETKGEQRPSPETDDYRRAKVAKRDDGRD